MGARSRARAAALQALYQLDLTGGEIDSVKEFLKNALEGEDSFPFAQTIVTGVREHLEELDEKISAVAENWSLARMAALDRNVLRLGAFELLLLDDAPDPVVIDEAVELAKRFSTKESGAFVNGILDKLKKSE